MSDSTIIDVRDLKFTYPSSSVQVLHGLDFAVQRGEIFGFLGPSGAGKSTTQLLLAGVLRGYRGSARVLGMPVAASGAAYYEHIGVSFELPNHFLKLTAIENLTYFAALYRSPRRSPAEVLRLVDLQDDGPSAWASIPKA